MLTQRVTLHGVCECVCVCGYTLGVQMVVWEGLAGCVVHVGPSGRACECLASRASHGFALAAAHRVSGLPAAARYFSSI